MTNIHDYLRWRGDLKLPACAFNEVDALILAKLAYLPFERIGLHKTSAPVTVHQAAVSLLLAPQLEKHVQWKDDPDFLRLLMDSRRFGSM